MNDLSDNPYVIASAADLGRDDLNDYIFNHAAPQNDVTIDRMYFLIREMLAYLGFNVNLLGYRYIAKLLQYYLVNNSFSLNSGLAYVSERYGYESPFIKSNIEKAIELNDKFRTLASTMLSADLSERECGEVESAVLILGAIFKRYYNCNVVGETETEEDKILVLHKNRMILNGK